MAQRQPKSFHIIERHNPQLNVYYSAKGQLSKSAAKRYESPLYGWCKALEYQSEIEYNAAIEKLRADGFTVHAF